MSSSPTSPRLVAATLVLATALPLGAAQAGTNYYSPRLGIYYELVPHGGAQAARLTSKPVAGSPLSQSQAQIEKGDMITHLDNAPIRSTRDLEGHFRATAVAFVNIRTGAAEARWVYLPEMNAPKVPRSTTWAEVPPRLVPRSYTAPNGDVHYSPRLGINYALVRHGAAYGARLTTNPVAGSPLWQSQAQIERGDMITHLDNQAITGPDDLERHRAATAVAFINVRTGAAEARWVYLPEMGSQGVPRWRLSDDRAMPILSLVPPPVPKLVDR